MNEIRLSDHLYKEARRAQAAGYASVDDFVAEQLESGFSEGEEDFDDRFTAEVLAGLDRISGDMKAGKSVSIEEVNKHLSETREAWLRDHAS